MKFKQLRLLLLLPVAALLMSQSCIAKTANENFAAQAIETDINKKDSIISIVETDSLRIYIPHFSRVDMVCQTMPSPQDSTVILCCAAAFTGKEIFDEGAVRPFEHRYIAGDHVADGTLFEGYRCRANTGCFAFYPESGTWEFAGGDYEKVVRKAEKAGGMAFGQTMMIADGKDVHNALPCKDNARNQYRALCELNGRLCVIDGRVSMSYIEFINALISAGVSHALYLDMGTGWNYSFYRDNDGTTRLIHLVRQPASTNWIVFYR